MYDCLIEFYKSTNSNLFLLTFRLYKITVQIAADTLTKFNKNT